MDFDPSPETYKLLDICKTCFFQYGTDGAVGYIYQSAKDSIINNGYELKDYISEIMSIGFYVALPKKQYDKTVVDYEISELTIDDIKNTLEEFKNGKNNNTS